MRHNRTLLKDARQIHLYIGVFTTPALLFFAITGALQTFSFHETTKGSNYKPPKILVELGQLHKKQTLVVPDKKPQPPTLSATDKPRGDRPHSDKPADNSPTGDKRDADKPNGDTQIGDRPAIDPQTTDQPTRDRSTGDKPSGEISAKPTPSAPTPEAKSKNLLPMKIFFLIVALSLVTSTVTGLYMSYKFIRNKTLITGVLLAGIVIPVFLTFL